MRQLLEKTGILALLRPFAIVQSGRANRAAWQGTSNSMMGVSAAEQFRLSVLIGRRAVRRLVGGLNAHPLLRWRFGSTKTDRLVIAPQSMPGALPSPARW
jgi:hypothetical protein